MNTQIPQQPKRPAPNVGSSVSPGPARPGPQRQGNKTVLYGALIFVIVLATLALVVPAILEARSSSIEGTMHIENIFLDIDNDGDEDFIHQADVLFNCAGPLCLPATPTASPPAASQLAPPTPEVMPAEGEPDG